MSNEEYQLLSLEEGRTEIPRALILVTIDGKPVSVYEVDVYGYESPFNRDCEYGCKDAGDHYHPPEPKTEATDLQGITGSFDANTASKSELAPKATHKD